MSTRSGFAWLVVLPFLLAACGSNPATSARPPGNGGGGSGGTGVPLNCGDGVLDDGEECDEGDDNSDTAPDACRADCTPARCGDGVIDAGEACDDGSGNSDVVPDACRTACVAPACGDGVRDAAEGCDDGTANSDALPDACRVACVPAGCNDGVVDGGEECDLGPENSDTSRDGCRTNCRYGYCGDGVIDTGEDCDDGPGNGNAPDACRRTCVPAHCGDGVHDSPEECDAGPDNSDIEADACRTSCTLPTCGDGVRDAGEACDAGAANSDATPDACRTGCALAACGDGVIDTGEACDAGPGNSDAAPDVCRTSCMLPGCGDGVRDAGEACDAGAGNSDTTPDSCRTSCVLPRCGDGVADAGEACDAGTGNSDTTADACRPGCLLPRCGDHVIDTGEECDDGGVLPNDGCSATCVVEPAVCGNGAREAPFEECDDGNLYDGDGCTHLCDWEVPAVCGGSLANPVIDLRVAGTPDGGNGYFYGRNTQYDLQAASTACGGAGPEAFHAYVIPVAGNLVVDVTVPPGGTLNPVLAVRRICSQSASELGCVPLPVGSGLPGQARRLVIRNVDPAWGPVYVQVDGFGATSGTYDLHVRVAPPLPAGAPCAADGSSGSCGASLACADPDGDGAGTCVPEVGPGAACDPARLVDACVAGYYCPAGPGPVCTPNCGNGRIDPGEECDDGNTSAGDNCSPACVQAGRECAAPFDLNRTWDATAKTATWNGDSRVFTAKFTGDCGSTATQPDGVAVFTAPAAGTYSFHLAPGGFDGAVYVWNGACGQGSPALACAAGATYGTPDTAVVSLAANQTVYVVVDGNGAGAAASGPFALTASQVVCGDGHLQPPEECDDGNIAGGDNCGPTCLEAGDDCTAPWLLAWDPVLGRASWSSTTVARGAEYSGSCSPASPGTTDAVARFVAPAAGTYAFQVDASWNAAVWLWGATCGQASPVLACSASRGAAIPEVVTATLGAGEAVHVVVDSAATGTAGPFALLVREAICGDGALVAPEQCDDGNLVPGDGCGATCQAELIQEFEPNDTRALARPVQVNRIYDGAIDPATDLDYYPFPATAGTHYTFETFVGSIGDCTAVVSGTSADTRLRLFDPAGNQLADDDDGGLGGVGRCSRIEWTAPASGTYYLLVRHYSDYSPQRITPYFVALQSP